MKRILSRFSVFGIISLIIIISACNNTSSTTFYLVRHAEKEEGNTTQKQNENPPLTKEGKQRAQKLTEVLPAKKIDAIYATPYQRNMHTVSPLADLHKITIKNYEWHDWQPMLEEAKKKHAGGVVVICGHGDNLLPMIEYLKGKRPQESLEPNEYDKIFRLAFYSDTSLVSVIQF